MSTKNLDRTVYDEVATLGLDEVFDAAMDANLEDAVSLYPVDYSYVVSSKSPLGVAMSLIYIHARIRAGERYYRAKD